MRNYPGYKLHLFQGKPHMTKSTFANVCGLMTGLYQQIFEHSKKIFFFIIVYSPTDKIYPLKSHLRLILDPVNIKPSNPYIFPKIIYKYSTKMGCAYSLKTSFSKSSLCPSNTNTSSNRFI